jgi:hypothetical protein
MFPKRILLLTIFLLLAWSLLGWASDSTQSDAEQMQSWWNDLEKSDPEASRALLKMSKKPDETVAFLKENLPALKIEPDEARQLLKDLESDDETVWKPSYEKLRYLDPRLAIELPVLMVEITNPVARPRMVEILSDRDQGSLSGKELQYQTFAGGQNFSDGRSSWWAEKDLAKLCDRYNEKAAWTRASRAIVLLEHIGTPAAVDVLKNLATGNPDAKPTKVAIEALENLDVSK